MVAIWLSKNCPKLDIFSKKLSKNFWKKKEHFLQFFWREMSSFGRFFDSQMAIFRRVRCQIWPQSGPICSTLVLNLLSLSALVEHLPTSRCKCTVNNLYITRDFITFQSTSHFVNCTFLKRSHFKMNLCEFQ